MKEEFITYIKRFQYNVLGTWQSLVGYIVAAEGFTLLGIAFTMLTLILRWTLVKLTLRMMAHEPSESGPIYPNISKQWPITIGGLAC